MVRLGRLKPSENHAQAHNPLQRYTTWITFKFSPQISTSPLPVHLNDYPSKVNFADPEKLHRGTNTNLVHLNENECRIQEKTFSDK